MKRFLACIMALIIGITATTGLQAITVQASDKSAADVTTLLDGVKGKLSEVFSGIDTETAEELFEFLKEKARDGSLKSKDGVEKAIKEGEEKFGVKISKADAEKIVDTMNKLEKLGFSGEYLIEKAQGLYKKYGAEFADHLDEIAADAVANAADNFIHGLWKSTKKFFVNFFSRS